MKNKTCFLLLFLFFSLQLIAGNAPEEGKTIFMSRCASCHNVNKVMTGPALAGVEQRRTLEWIVNFVHSSQTMIKKGDQVAVALFEQFNKVPMPDHADLTETHIKSIVEYIKVAAVSGDQNKEPFSRPAKRIIQYLPLNLSRDYWWFISYAVAICLLIASLAYMVRVNDWQRRKGIN